MYWLRTIRNGSTIRLAGRREEKEKVPLMTGGRLYWANRWAANRPWTRLKPTRPGFGLEAGAAIDRSRYTGVVGWFLASLYRVHRHLPFFVMPLVSPSVYASRLSSLFSFFVNIGTYSTIKESDLLRRVRRYNDPAVVIYYFCACRIGKKKKRMPFFVGRKKLDLRKSTLLKVICEMPG